MSYLCHIGKVFISVKEWVFQSSSQIPVEGQACRQVFKDSCLRPAMRTGFYTTCKACISKPRYGTRAVLRGKFIAMWEKGESWRIGSLPKKLGKKEGKIWAETGVKERDVFQGGQIFEHDYSLEQMVRDEAGETGSPETIQDLSWFHTKAHDFYLFSETEKCHGIVTNRFLFLEVKKDREYLQCTLAENLLCLINIIKMGHLSQKY